MQIFSGAAIVTYVYPIATGPDGSYPDVMCTPGSGSVFAVGTTAVTCTATDGSGGSISVTFDINVSISAPVGGSVLFFDDFEDGNLDGWAAPGVYAAWMAGALDESVYSPGHDFTNKVAEA